MGKWTLVEKEQWSDKKPDEMEDRIVFGPTFGAIFDGHSSYCPKSEDCRMTPGRVASMAAGDALSCLAESMDSKPQLLLRQVNGYVHTQLSQMGYFEEPEEDDETGTVPYYRPGCVGVIFLTRRNQIIKIGDCQYFIDGMGKNPALFVDQHKAQVRRSVLRPYIEDLKRPLQELLATDPSTQIVEHLHRNWQRLYRNDGDVDGGYPVIDGTEIPLSLIKVIDVPRDAREVILTSDGIFPAAVCKTVGETKAKLKQIIDDDPLCIRDETLGPRGRKPGHTWLDDCSYMRFVRE